MHEAFVKACRLGFRYMDTGVTPPTRMGVSLFRLCDNKRADGPAILLGASPRAGGVFVEFEAGLPAARRAEVLAALGVS